MLKVKVNVMRTLFISILYLLSLSYTFTYVSVSKWVISVGIYYYFCNTLYVYIYYVYSLYFFLSHVLHLFWIKVPLLLEVGGKVVEFASGKKVEGLTDWLQVKRDLLALHPPQKNPHFIFSSSFSIFVYFALVYDDRWKNVIWSLLEKEKDLFIFLLGVENSPHRPPLGVSLASFIYVDNIVC